MVNWYGNIISVKSLNDAQIEAQIEFTDGNKTLRFPLMFDKTELSNAGTALEQKAYVTAKIIEYGLKLKSSSDITDILRNNIAAFQDILIE